MFRHHENAALSDHDLALLDLLHLYKIRDAEAVYVVTSYMCFEDGTRREIGYARGLGLPVYVLNYTQDADPDLPEAIPWEMAAKHAKDLPGSPVRSADELVKLISRVAEAERLIHNSADPAEKDRLKLRILIDLRHIEESRRFVVWDT